jgi:uncharacterized repeat protein (TIGR01451 family)
MRKLIFLSLIIVIFSTVGDASTQKFNFTMENNTALNFENGSYIIEVIEVSGPMYLKVNLTSSNKQAFKYLYDSEAPIIFDQIALSTSSITETSASITIEFPVGWGYPKKYQIVRPVAPVGIPNIILTKSADKINMNVGDIVEFKIKMENTGNATAYNLTLDEQLPAGFSIASGSRLPSVINSELAAGASQELYYALKAVESGTFNIDPTIAIYSSETPSKSNSLTITVAKFIQDKSNLNTVISLDKKNVYTDELIKASIKITNTGKADAKSVLVEGTPPPGLEVIEGDLRQVYDSIAPSDVIEYRVTLKAKEPGNYTLHLRTAYNDDEIGVSSESENIIVTEKEKNSLYIFLPVIIIIAGIVLFTIKRHKEYSY